MRWIRDARPIDPAAFRLRQLRGLTTPGQRLARGDDGLWYVETPEIKLTPRRALGDLFRTATDRAQKIG